LRPAGVLFLALPDKRLTFDIRRPVTPLEHLLRDYREGPAWSFHQHIREWVELVENQAGAAADARSQALIDEGVPSIHYHVWTHESLAEFFIGLRRDLHFPFEVEAVALNRLMGEAIAVLRKTCPVTSSASPAA
jgi:hypothetical protein